jgi:hypothetical protein
LWEPEENGGTPLLGNPTAAVLYPGKLIFFALPHALAARIYVVAHTVIAYLGMLAFARSLGVSRVGSTIAATSYAFGTPVLFLHCNIIYLVGAAWTPLALREATLWLREGHRSSLVALAVVLALQVLGGDPQAAYLAVLCAAGYALALGGSGPRNGRKSASLRVALGALIAVAWIASSALLAPRLPAMSVRAHQAPLWIAWSLAGVVLAWIALRNPRSDLARRLGRLLGVLLAGVLAVGLTGAQTVPVAENLSRSVRVSEVGTFDLYYYDLDLYTVAEGIWPGFFGSFAHGERYWLQMLPPALRHGIWVPSPYFGTLSLILALSAAGLGPDRARVGWLTAIAIISLLASLGKTTSPAFWMAPQATATAEFNPAVAADPHAPGDGSVYWGLAVSLPLFASFRFPGKLVGITTLALAALAGIGWDRVRGAGARRALPITLGLVVVSLSLLAVPPDWMMTHLARLRTRNTPLFGPIDLAGAIADCRGAVLHGLIAQAVAAVVLWLARRRPYSAAAVALLAVAVDLGSANARLVVTTPQSDLDGSSAVHDAIQSAERRDPARYPFRVASLPSWIPIGWSKSHGPDRIRQWVTWERETLQPDFGINRNISYTYNSLNNMELYDYWLFFRSFPRVLDADAARAIMAEPGQTIFYQPRRGFDLWTSRYFILPAFAYDWSEPARCYASLIDNTDLIYPDPALFDGPDGQERRRRWLDESDVQVRKNRAVYPRAWVVREGRLSRPIEGLKESDRNRAMAALLFQNDVIWKDTDRPVFDLHRAALVETDQPAKIAPFLPGGLPDAPSERVAITRYEPQRVEIDVRLDRPGIVVLADVFFPGWKLTIDGVPTTILRVNRMMRGAAVPAGPHKLVYGYDPDSLKVGAAVSLASLAALLAMGVWSRRAPNRLQTRVPPASG